MTPTKEELQAARSVLLTVESDCNSRNPTLSKEEILGCCRNVRAVLEAAISKMETVEELTKQVKNVSKNSTSNMSETTTEKLSGVDENGLKPCPFCGSKPLIHLGKKNYCQLHGDPYQGYIVKCSNGYCVARNGIGGVGDIFNGGKEKAYAEAVSKWNTRAAQPAVDVEILVDCLFNEARRNWPWSDITIPDGPSLRFAANYITTHYALTKREGV